MTLIKGSAPLAAEPSPGNYAIDGPAHRLFFDPFPRRVRALLGDRVVLDTVRGQLLHETNILPVLYAPIEDIDPGLLEPSDKHTHCPFKGDASYWSLRDGDRFSKDAVWTYREPNEESSWLRGYAAFYWDRVDRWFDEDVEVRTHLRDPYHRVDARPSSRRVQVVCGDVVLAESDAPVLLYETSLPVRAYVRREDVRAELVASDTRTHCPYKGDAIYFTPRLEDGRELTDAIWSYTPENLLPDGPPAIAGRVAFLHKDVEVRIGEPARVEGSAAPV
jgi:uncharacterized protein (DUF427 family)